MGSLSEDAVEPPPQVPDVLPGDGPFPVFDLADGLRHPRVHRCGDTELQAFGGEIPVHEL